MGVRPTRPYLARLSWVTVRLPGPWLWLLAVLAFLLALAAAWPDLWERWERWRHGMPPGVHLVDAEQGIRLGLAGYLPAEVQAQLQDLAVRLNKAPVNARWDPVREQVIPEQPGREVDVEATMQAIRNARRGSDVQLVWKPVPPRVTRSFFEPVRQGPPGPWAALMFNVAWGEEHLPALLKALAGFNVQATFFLDGQWAQKFPEWGRKLQESGHEVASHGFRHDHVEKMDPGSLASLIAENERLLRRQGVQPAPLFAPPYGEVNGQIVRTAAEMGYRTILWTVDTVDWKRPPAAVIADRVFRRYVPGSLILMHPTEPTVQALPIIIQGLHQKGVRLMTVSQLLEAGSPREPSSAHPD